MNRFNSTLAVALLCAGFSAGAPAQEKSTAAQTTDKAHATSKSSQSANKPKGQQQKQLGSVKVRNWRAIDKNHDNLIEPDEMEDYLKQKG